MRIEEKEGSLVITDFNEVDAYKIASTVEKDGIRFYESLVNGLTNEDTRKRISFLMDEERSHLKFFENQLSQASQGREDNFEDDDLMRYMDYGIFQPYQGMKNLGEKIDDVRKVLKLGIIVEEKSIKFYQFCRDRVSEDKAKNELQNIINEEKAHKTILENIMELQEDKN